MYRVDHVFLPAMLEVGHGNIINMSRVTSGITGVPHGFVFGTTKVTVIGMTKSIAADFVGRS